LLVYKLSKDKLAYGPMQIEARIDQQTEISRELSLWDQRGSRVIRGNLLAIPVSNSFIYVEPIYLEAKQEEEETTRAGSPQSNVKSQKQQNTRSSRRNIARTAALPELKRVIVALGNRVAMEKKLDQALLSVLEVKEIPAKVQPVHITATQEEPSKLGVLALEYYLKAKEYLQQGDWAGYGKQLEKLEEILKQLSKTTADNK
jgi:uncharacterized membrane protein (UPF0182 family)